MADWESMPRLLWDLCDGHPGRSVELYAFDHGPCRLWLCKGCWASAWEAFKAQSRSADG